jgi:hypothetical protein
MTTGWCRSRAVQNARERDLVQRNTDTTITPKSSSKISNGTATYTVNRSESRLEET